MMPNGNNQYNYPPNYQNNGNQDRNPYNGNNDNRFPNEGGPQGETEEQRRVMVEKQYIQDQIKKIDAAINTEIPDFVVEYTGKINKEIDYLKKVDYGRVAKGGISRCYQPGCIMVGVTDPDLDKKKQDLKTAEENAKTKIDTVLAPIIQQQKIKVEAAVKEITDKLDAADAGFILMNNSLAGLQPAAIEAKKNDKAFSDNYIKYRKLVVTDAKTMKDDLYKLLYLDKHGYDELGYKIDGIDYKEKYNTLQSRIITSLQTISKMKNDVGFGI